MPKSSNGRKLSTHETLAEELKRYIEPFRTDGSQSFRLKSQKTCETGGLDKQTATEIIGRNRVRLGIFNRSYYEECLTVRVHRQLLAKELIPSQLVTRNVWRERFEDISAYEKHLSRNGTLILKFFLNISKDEQRKRLLDRLQEPGK